MTPSRIAAIADEHLYPWLHGTGPDSEKTLRERVCDAISAALYEEGCRHGTPPHDLNNPQFVRQCGPQHDQE